MWMFATFCDKFSGIDLRYQPLSLHQLVIECPTTRKRETNGKTERCDFFVVKFHTKYLPIIEEKIQQHDLESLAKQGKDGHLF